MRKRSLGSLAHRDSRFRTYRIWSHLLSSRTGSHLGGCSADTDTHIVHMAARTVSPRARTGIAASFFSFAISLLPGPCALADSRLEEARRRGTATGLSCESACSCAAGRWAGEKPHATGLVSSYLPPAPRVGGQPATQRAYILTYQMRCRCSLAVSPPHMGAIDPDASHANAQRSRLCTPDSDSD